MLLIIILVLLFLFGGYITQFYSCIHGKKEKNILIRVEKIDIAGFKKKFLLKIPIKLIDQAG
jgi:hypothetical protein